MSALPDPTSPKAPAFAPGANAPAAPTPLVGLLEKDFDRLQEPLARKAKEAKQKRCKSICDARYVTCYPRAGVSHFTLGRACHM